MELHIMQFSPASCTSFFLGQNVLLSALFSNALNLCSSINAREHVLHPYIKPKCLPSGVHWHFKCVLHATSRKSLVARM